MYKRFLEAPVYIASDRLLVVVQRSHVDNAAEKQVAWSPFTRQHSCIAWATLFTNNLLETIWKVDGCPIDETVDTRPFSVYERNEAKVLNIVFILCEKYDYMS